MFSNYELTAAMKEGMSSWDFSKACTASLNYIFTKFLIMIPLSVTSLVGLVEEGLGFLWENLGLLLVPIFFLSSLPILRLNTQSLICFCWQRFSPF